MKGLLVVFLGLVALVAAQDTNINFSFAGMLEGAGGSSNNNNGDSAYADFWEADQLTAKWFSITNQGASDDNADGVAAKYGPQLQSICTKDVVIIYEKNGQTLTYDFDHVGDYIGDVAQTIQEQLRFFVDKKYEISPSGDYMTVVGTYFGSEQTRDATPVWRTFTGVQTFGLTNINGQWMVNRVSRVRFATFVQTLA